jgi:hypothetical protein
VSLYLDVELLHEVRIGGTSKGQYGATNFIAGAGITISGTEDPTNDEVEVTIAHDTLGTGDPHPQYTTDAEATVLADASAATAVATHAGLADPHTGYQKESEKGAAGGYASLDGGATVPDAQIPSAIARDAEVTSAINSAITTHEGGADPHTGYQKESEKGAASGYASLDGSGTVPDAQIPAAIARDAEVTSAIATHAGEADPHSGYLLESLLDAKGDLIVATANNTPSRLAVGTDDMSLVADSGQAAGLKYAWPNLPSCLARHSISQSIASGSTFVALSFNTDLHDDHGFHSTVSNTSRLTVPTGYAGKYIVFANFAWTASATGRRWGAIRYNGSEIKAHEVDFAPGAAEACGFSLSVGPIALADADYVECGGYQSSGGSLSVLADATGDPCEFGLVRISD